uniref:Putative monocarboxylate transporter n=1 Tax=Ixodes ricinus TaxID=34613 RepID=A0A6B0UTX6_IXORI
MAVLLAFMGICFLLLPFANWYTFLLIVTCAIGFGIGTCLVSASVIVTQRVSVEMTSVAFGVVYGICGILSFGKPPIIARHRRARQSVRRCLGVRTQADSRTSSCRVHLATRETLQEVHHLARTTTKVTLDSCSQPKQVHRQGC